MVLMKYISTSIYKGKNQRNKEEDIHDVTVRHELNLFSLGPKIVFISTSTQCRRELRTLYIRNDNSLRCWTDVDL